MWRPWWTSPKRGWGNVNSLLRCSTFIHCWHFFFPTSLVSRFRKQRWASFGTMLAAVTHGAPTILVLTPTYHLGYTATVQDTRIKQDSRKNCCASRSTCHCGHHGVFAVQDSWCSLFARAWWWTLFAQCGRSIATLLLPSTNCFRVEFLWKELAATLMQDSALLLPSCVVIGLSIVMLCSWTVDGVQTTAVSNVLQLWQVAPSNIRILRTPPIGLETNFPMYSSWTCASSLVQFVTWLYWIWFLGFCKSNTGDFSQYIVKLPKKMCPGITCLGPLFGLIGFHAEMIRFCWTHNWHLGLYHRSNGSAMLFGDASIYIYIYL